MKVRARLFGDLRGLVSTDDELVEAELTPGATVAELVAHLGIDRAELWRASVNGQLAEFDQRLQESDEVFLFPPIGGGEQPTMRG